MAIIHSRKNEYLSNNLLISKYAVVVWASLLILIAVIIATRTPLQAIVLTLLILIPILFAIKQLNIEGINKLRFGNGITGEKEVLKELIKLPDEYHVFSSIRLPGNKGDIDYVVVSPSQVYTIEAKSHKGEITYEDGELKRNGNPFEKKVREQTWHHSNNLKNYLFNNGINMTPVPVLVFSRASMRFGIEPIISVYVINKQYLYKLFEKFESEHALNNKEEIIGYLEKI